MNFSKIKQMRFWLRWEKSGSIKNLSEGDWIVDATSQHFVGVFKGYKILSLRRFNCVQPQKWVVSTNGTINRKWNGRGFTI